MFSKIKHVACAFISLLLFLNVSAFVIEDILDNKDLNVEVESLQVSPEARILAISINQIDQVFDENGQIVARPRVLSLNLNVNERQLIEEGIKIYNNIPVYAADIKDGVDMLEAELMNEKPSVLPAKMFGWADVEYDEEQDIFYPRVVLQTQIPDRNAVKNEVVQVIIDLPESGEILVFPPHKLPFEQIYSLPEDTYKTPHGHKEETSHKHHKEEHKHHHKCGHMHKGHPHKHVKNYFHKVGKAINGWLHKAAKKINEWTSDNIDEIQLFVLTWITMVAVVMLFIAFPIIFLLHIRRTRREALTDLEVTEALLKDEDTRDEKILPRQYHPVKIDEAFSTGEEKGLLDDHE